MEPHEPSLFYRLAMALLKPIFFWALIFYLTAVLLVIVISCGAINIVQDNPVRSSVQLVGVKGLDEPALSPSAVSPAFDLLVRVDNGHIYDEFLESGGVTVSYAGVPLAHGHTPRCRVMPKATLTFVVNATTEAVGLPADLFRLMSAERRWGAAELEVRMQMGSPNWESFTWSIDLDG